LTLTGIETIVFCTSEKHANYTTLEVKNYKKECTRLAATSDKVYQLLAHGWWFSPGTPASSTTTLIAMK
jgi:hypothetical protein